MKNYPPQTMNIIFLYGIFGSLGGCIATTIFKLDFAFAIFFYAFMALVLGRIIFHRCPHCKKRLPFLDFSILEQCPYCKKHFN